ncbi:MAG: hypothetical protein SVK08_07785 [Halobacteriota archaeon]|nr:hypothetical protein [Halobacteriota archaeon]
MPRDFSNDEMDVNEEKRLHESTLEKYRHLDVNVRSQKMEALEKVFSEAIKNKVKARDGKIRQSLAKDFLEKYRGEQRPDQHLIDFLRGTSGGNFGGVHNREFEPDPTGFEELPWERDEDF